MSTTNLNQFTEDYQAASSKPLSALYDQLQVAHQSMFSSDVLYGASLDSQYRQWINYQLKPRLRKLGKEGQLWWLALTQVDLASDPELLWRLGALLSMWFFPEYHEYLRYAETVALLAVIRKLAGNEDLDK